MFLSQRLPLAAVLLLFSMCSTPALSDTLYAHSGSDFFVVTGFSEPQITTSDFLFFSLTLSGPPLICPTGCLVSPISWDIGFSGLGLHINFGGAPNIFLSESVFLQTNAAGQIVAWQISGCLFDRPPECDNNFSTSHGGDGIVLGSLAAFSDGPGTWVITTVPEPTTFIMLGSGLLALAGIVRQRFKKERTRDAPG